MNKINSAFLGVWTIYKQVHVDWDYDETVRKLQLSDEDQDDEAVFLSAVKRWLFEKIDLAPMSQIAQTKGCALTISSDETFIEKIDPNIPRDPYNNNHNGVSIDSRLHEGRIAFDATTDEITFLPRVYGEGFEAPEIGAELDRMMYDYDGMPVCDRAYLDSGHLVRLVSALVDGAYLTRSILTYVKSESEK